jgi:hypothetical protein
MVLRPDVQSFITGTRSIITKPCTYVEHVSLHFFSLAVNASTIFCSSYGSYLILLFFYMFPFMSAKFNLFHRQFK